MKAYFLFTASSPLVILTSYDFIKNPELMENLTAKGIGKFVACELPLELCREKYGQKFDTVCNNVRETDDLRVLDFSGERAFKIFKFKEMGSPIYYEPG